MKRFCLLLLAGFAIPSALAVTPAQIKTWARDRSLSNVVFAVNLDGSIAWGDRRPAPKLSELRTPPEAEAAQRAFEAELASARHSTSASSSNSFQINRSK